MQNQWGKMVVRPLKTTEGQLNGNSVFRENLIFWDLKYFISHRNKNLESFIYKHMCSRTAVLWLRQEFLACRKPSFRTLFWICDSIGEKPKPLGFYLFWLRNSILYARNWGETNPFPQSSNGFNKSASSAGKLFPWRLLASPSLK